MKELAQKYFDQINGPFKGLNLTSHETLDELYVKQFEDSIVPFEMFGELDQLICDSNLIIDLGFGGGFPIIPLAKKYSQKEFVGIDARKKKADAVREISKALGITNAKFVHARMEEVNIDVKNVLVVNKAVGKIHDILSMINGPIGAKVLFFKGVNVYDLEADSNKKFNIPRGWKFLKTFEIKLPNLEKRYIILFEKLDSTVPRGTKNDLKFNLSEHLKS